VTSFPKVTYWPKLSDKYSHFDPKRPFKNNSSLNEEIFFKNKNRCTIIFVTTMEKGRLAFLHHKQ